MTEHTTVRVILVDGPIVHVETSDKSFPLPLKTSVGTFDEAIEELTKHAVVYLWEAEHYPYPTPTSLASDDNVKIRWGSIE
ncbi:MAG: hypothetical protein RR212_01170 [Bacteroidales bacterium]